MGITAALALAIQRLGLDDEPISDEANAEDNSGHDELVVELRYVRDFAPRERFKALLGLLERFPFDASLAAALVEFNWLDGRLFEQGLIAWDLLNNVIFPRGDAATVDALRARVAAIGDLRPAANRATIKPSPKVLRKRLLSDLEKRGGDGLKGAKRRAAKRSLRWISKTRTFVHSGL